MTTTQEALPGTDGLGTTEPTSVGPPGLADDTWKAGAPARGARPRGEPGVQLACRKVLAALDGLDPSAQLRVLRAAALLLGPDAPADA